MEYTFHRNPEEYVGTVSNLHGFFHRYLDTGFKSKWSGFWSPPYKFLDYYSLKVNGVWLGPQTLQGVEYGEEMVFYHETDTLEIVEKVKTPESLPGFKVELELRNRTDEIKAAQIIMETAVDIRHRGQDIGPEEYNLEEGNDRITVGCDDRNLLISSKNIGLRGESYMKEHHPGEKQRCFVPGEIVFQREIFPESAEPVKIEFTTSKGSFKTIKSKEQSLEHCLGRSFEHSISSLENLIYDRNGLGIIAGHPWFQNYWARDTFWSILGLIDAGYFEPAEEILENFVEKDVPGKINVDGSDTEIKRSDTQPLFIIAADKLRRHYRLNKGLQRAQRRAMKQLDIEEGTVIHPGDGTWMDTLEREKAVDIQSLWLEAANIMNDPRKNELKKGLEKFKGSDYIKDSLVDDSHTINPAIPLMFGQFDKKMAKKQLEKINGEFSSRYGARTRSITDPGFDPSGYHTGSVWGLTTGWAAAANLRYGECGQGRNFLEKLSSLLDRNQPGALPEVVNAETGKLLGCPEQAWSAGMLVHVIDSYLLGIKPSDDHIEIDPSGNVSCERRGKRIGEEKIDLKFNDGEVEVMDETDMDIRT